MEEKRDWLQMPDEIMGGMILQRLDVDDILMSVEKVCRNWRRICKDPAMWKIIDSDHKFDGWCGGEYEDLIKHAVDRSCGELIDISLGIYGSDHLLDHITRCSSKLNRLCLIGCYAVTSSGLKDIKVIGRNCPQLKSFKMETMVMDVDIHAHAIANSMPGLRHLKLAGAIGGDDGVQAILNGCPHLESLDLCRCFYLDDLEKDFEKLCRERIKDFNL
ncbi:hypothetical protein OSB04_002011 [Centaurea solstitialis]|uniref:F-box domain-containing protein n=1 Tax=Centaurea solstitialis TaxID=347529 RepID=A0AA38WSZ2_9ASTR|nr:hypothetical protein OSB04_002011 [Centaurea solstitialis]